MKTNLKDNIWIEGFNTAFWENVVGNDPYKTYEGNELIYFGKTSEIPEEIANEYIDIEYFGEYWQGMWEYKGYKNFDINTPYDHVHTAEESIKSACNSEYCIIYKK